MQNPWFFGSMLILKKKISPKEIGVSERIQRIRAYMDMYTDTREKIGIRIWIRDMSYFSQHWVGGMVPGFFTKSRIFWGYYVFVFLDFRLGNSDYKNLESFRKLNFLRVIFYTILGHISIFIIVRHHIYIFLFIQIIIFVDIFHQKNQQNQNRKKSLQKLIIVVKKIIVLYR